VLWPFDKLSPWNRPLGANAVYQPIVSGLTGGGFTTGFMNHSKWTVSFWIASPSDPVRKIYSKNWAGSLKGSGEFIERRIPDAAVPSPDSDGDMLVISSDHSTILEFYRAVRLPNGNLQVSNADEVDLNGMGTRGIVTNGMSLTGGNIRAGELRTGIKHALAFTTSAKMWNRFAPGGKPYVWPARRADGYAIRPEPGGFGSSGNLYIGSFVAIPSTVNVNALGLETPEGRVLARALQDYGAIGATTGGSGSRIVFRYDYAAYMAGDLNSLLTNWTAFHRDLNRIARQLHVVVNSHQNGQSPTLGPTEGISGGTPRTSFAPDFPSSSNSSR
jgi:hypothetical protein